MYPRQSRGHVRTYLTTRPGLARWSWLVGFLVLWLTLTGCQKKTELSSRAQDITYTGTGQDIRVASWESELPTDIILVRHPPQSGWLDEWGRLKGGHPSL